MIEIYVLDPEGDQETEIKLAPSSNGLLLKISRGEDKEVETILSRQEVLDLGMTILKLANATDIILSEAEKIAKENQT